MSWQCSWRVSIGFVVSAMGVALTAVSAPSRADEAYLCAPDKVVYVSTADLPKLKRTDPCIAAYYGLTVETPAKPAAAVAASIKPSTPLPAKKPAAVVLKPLAEAEATSRPSVQPAQLAALTPPSAMPATDYRNVKILNASRPDDAWFRHTK